MAFFTGVSFAADPDGSRVTLTTREGQTCTYSPQWLALNGPGAFHPRTGQRVLAFRHLPEPLEIERLHVTPEGGLAIKFEGLPLDEWTAERLVTLYPGHQDSQADRVASMGPAPELWTLEEIAGGQALPVCEAGDLEQPEGTHRCLDALFRRGAVRVTGLPTVEGTVAALAERFGFVRTTNYGRVFDVISLPEAEHLAYTGVALDPHTDNPYRDPVPGIQLLHCLEADVSGGVSLLVDGLAIAERLRAAQPGAFKTLTETLFEYQYSDSTCDLRHRRPVIDQEPDGAIRAVHFNERSMAPFLSPEPALSAQLAALRAFGDLANDEAWQARFSLKPGEAILFDNQRMLHGRTALVVTGRRRLQGCYADKDAFLSAWRRSLSAS